MTFSQRFNNWLRWCAEHGGEPRGQCGSGEGAYRSPQCWDVVEPNMGKLYPVNVPDAESMNRAYVGLSDYDRRVIKYVYFRRHWRPSWMAQKLNCHYTQIILKLNSARKNFELSVDKVDEKEYLALARRTGNRYKPLVEAWVS